MAPGPPAARCSHTVLSHPFGNFVRCRFRIIGLTAWQSPVTGLAVGQHRT